MILNILTVKYIIQDNIIIILYYIFVYLEVYKFEIYFIYLHNGYNITSFI